MYKLKKKYEGCSTSTGGYLIILNDVKPEQVEGLGLEAYFDKKSVKKEKSTEKKDRTSPM